jgi:hypothetical protein
LDLLLRKASPHVLRQCFGASAVAADRAIKHQHELGIAEDTPTLHSSQYGRLASGVATSEHKRSQPVAKALLAETYAQSLYPLKRRTDSSRNYCFGRRI